MLKKNQLSEKLKKLKIEGVSKEKTEKKEEKASKKTKPDAVVKKTLESPKPSIQKKSKPPKPSKTEEAILQVKKPESIEEKKPEELIEPLFEEKKELHSISDLAIPSKKLAKLFKIETTFTEDTLTQLLTAWKDPEKVVKWTAKIDKHGEEFYSLKNEGLVKMKDQPPIYGMELDDGAVIATHMGKYTFIMGCYNFGVKALVKIFAYGIENARRYSL